MSVRLSTIALATALLSAAAIGGEPPQAAVGAWERREKGSFDSGPVDLGLFEENAPRRSLVRLDFEENETFPREVPVGWRRVLTNAGGPPGYPDFGSIEAVRGAGRRREPAEAAWAVRFKVDGASMALACEPGRVAAVPGAQLLAAGWVRTTGLRHAAARLSVQFTGADGAPIGGIHSSPAVRSESGWRQLRVAPPLAPEGAASALVWLEVVQPRSLRAEGDARPDSQFDSQFDSRFEVAAIDVAGEAIFDDVEIWQLPTATFEAEGAEASAAVVAPGARPRLSLRCSDPASPTSRADVEVRDAVGAVVHRTSLDLEAGRLQSIALPALPAGWYEAEANLTNHGEPVAVRSARFAVLPKDPFEPEEPPRFGISLASPQAPLEPMVDLARAAFVVLPAWSAETDLRAPTGQIDALRPILTRLRDRGIEPILRLAAVPAPLALEERVDQGALLALFAREESRWLPSLEPWLLACSQQVDEWILGDEPIPDQRAEVAAGIAAVTEVLGRSIAGPNVRLPWSPAEPFAGPVARQWTSDRHGLEIIADAAWRESASEAFAGLPTGARGMVRVVPLPPGLVDESARATDLALRAIDAWRAGFDAISLDVRPGSLPSVPGPSRELVAWHQLSTSLSSRRFVREVPIADGVRALLADGARGAALVVWSEREDEVEVDVDLGQEPVTTVDLWGRRTSVPGRPEGHRLRIGRTPAFVEGVGLEACLLRAGFRVEPGFVAARRSRQEAALVLANPWRMPLTGTIRVLAPDELGLSPAVQRFSIEPQGEARIPITFTVPRALESGPIAVRVHVEGMAAEPVSARLTATLEVGFREVAVESSWRLARSIESGAIDLVLVTRVTNRSDRVLDVEAFAVADGFTQTKKPVTGLGPGQSAVRVFRFPGGARRLSGRDVRTGVQDLDGDVRLLHRVPIPPLLPPEARIATGAER